MRRCSGSQPLIELRAPRRALVLSSQRLSLPLDAVGAGVGFDEYGLDSILVMDLTDALRVMFGAENISATLFFEHHDIEGLVEHFLRTQPTALAQWAGLAAPTPPAEPIKVTHADSAVVREIYMGIPADAAA